MKNKKVFSFTKGYAFDFDVDGHNILAWFSSFSGLEKVFVDGTLVSSQRNYSTDSSDSFLIDNIEYQTHLKAVSFLKGPYVCTLSKNGKPYKRKKIVFNKPVNHKSKNSFIVKLIVFIVIGFIFGIVSGYYNLPEETFYIFIAIVFFGVFAYNLKNPKYLKPFIEDEEIV